MERQIADQQPTDDSDDRGPSVPVKRQRELVRWLDDKPSKKKKISADSGFLRTARKRGRKKSAEGIAKTCLHDSKMKKNRDGSVSTNSGAFGMSTNEAAAIKYAPYETRKNTYEPLCKPGLHDQVRGLHCSRTLRDWKSGDEPFVKHRRRKHQPQKSVDFTNTTTEKDKKIVLQKKAEKEWKANNILPQATPFIQRATNRKSYESKKYMVEDISQVEEDANMDSNRMETTSSVPDNLKWIFNPSLHGISSAVPPAPSYLTDVLCYTSGQLSDTHNPLSTDLLQKLDGMSPQEYRAAIRNDLSTIQLDWLMSVETRRRKTFLDNWPHAGNLSGERMAQAGFYHRDGYDNVRCVFCGVVINKWETEDNPIAEHTRWVPLCWFVQSLKCEMASSHVQPTDAHPAPIQEGQPGAGDAAVSGGGGGAI